MVNKVAWAPQSSAPMELTAVLVKAGQMTDWQWIKALSDRVTELALAESNPAQATLQACRYLGLPATDNPQEAGQFLVEGNWKLQDFLDVAMESQFPMQATENQAARQAIEETTLESWVELAVSQVSESSLD